MTDLEQQIAIIEDTWKKAHLPNFLIEIVIQQFRKEPKILSDLLTRLKTEKNKYPLIISMNTIFSFYFNHQLELIVDLMIKAWKSKNEIETFAIQIKNKPELLKLFDDLPLTLPSEALEVRFQHIMNTA